MKKPVIIFFLTLCCLFSQAQFGSLGNRIKNAAKNKVEEKSADKTSDAVGKGFDSVFKKKKGKDAAEEQAEEKGEESAADDAGDAVDTEKNKSVTLTSYSKFDFIPGEKTLYAEDFSQDAVGELPLSWNTTGKGEIMTIEGKEGKWLRGFQNNTVLTGNTKTLGENYTIEFDLIYFFDAKPNYSFPALEFGLVASRDKSTTDNSMLTNWNSTNAVTVHLHSQASTQAYVESFYNSRETYESDWMNLKNFFTTFNKVHHYAIQVQKTRFRFWLDDQKVFDVPRGVNTQDQMNQFFFRLAGSSYTDEQVGYYLTNLKFATGMPDTRHKLIEEGKFSTTGILFAVNSAVIKPESYAVLKDIGTVLKDNPAVRIRINGHTSSDGNAKANLELSKQRAAAVKAMLVKDFGIGEDRMQTEGIGDREPVGDNKTQEGRVQNRRVEFIKI